MIPYLRQHCQLGTRSMLTILYHVDIASLNLISVAFPPLYGTRHRNRHVSKLLKAVHLFRVHCQSVCWLIFLLFGIARIHKSHHGDMP